MIICFFVFFLVYLIYLVFFCFIYLFLYFIFHFLFFLYFFHFLLYFLLHFLINFSQVSYNRSALQLAQFKDRILPHKDYFVADASEDQIFLCVNHNESQTHLYISEAQGKVLSSFSKENEFFPNKEKWIWKTIIQQYPLLSLHCMLAGISFSLSLENVVYFNPATSSSWMSILTSHPFADVHKVEGLRGIYIASVVLPKNKTEERTRPFWAPMDTGT